MKIERLKHRARILEYFIEEIQEAIFNAGEIEHYRLIELQAEMAQELKTITETLGDRDYEHE